MRVEPDWRDEGDTVLFDSVCFGDSDEPAQRSCAEAHGRAHLEDVDHDADIDLVLHYEVAATGIDRGDTLACLTGVTREGGALIGCDHVPVR